MKIHKQLFENNARWAAAKTKEDPEFFTRNSDEQKPKYLWIGCSDSRVPANQIVGLPPGEMFVHRNVGNLILHSDFNALSAIEFSIGVLKVPHIIVCGHYGCGGVRAAMQDSRLGLIDNWLRHIRDVYTNNLEELSAINDDKARNDRLCELNVVEQVRTLCQTTIVQRAWEARQPLSVHGWIYSIYDGRLRDLGLTATSLEECILKK